MPMPGISEVDVVSVTYRNAKKIIDVVQFRVTGITYTYSVDEKNQLDVTFCILYFSSNSCSTCFGQPYAHHQELMTA